MAARELRDATAAELFGEPTVVLTGLVDGSIGASPATRELAARELDFRRLHVKLPPSGDEARDRARDMLERVLDRWTPDAVDLPADTLEQLRDELRSFLAAELASVLEVRS